MERIMFRGLMAILFGPIGLMLHDQISDDMATKRDLKKLKQGYTGVRITGDEEGREEAIKQFLGRVQKQSPRPETNNSRDGTQASPDPIPTAGETTGQTTPEA
jgi:hypothetical protein